MNCPVCKEPMVEEDFGGVLVDVCQAGCKGIWFDWKELSRLDEKNEGFGQALQDALHYPRTNPPHREKLPCPKCGVLMFAHQYQSAKEVNVDECYGCGGFFLDSGELQEIRDAFMSEHEREAYFQKLVGELPVARDMKRDLEREKARAEALRRYTRFLRLSYYVAGK